ncbi:hypothetical protein ACNF40_06745 [Cuniculiplasma sp. SKW4]|uniref:hypothetical protein n=1 Tax=Cuniculiplasma sp. SKW4 TaxID=3400171 RepID=UPI003FD3F29E
MPASNSKEMKGKVEHLIEEYFLNRDIGRKTEILNTILEILDNIEGKSLFRNDSEFSGKIDALAKDLWKLSNQGDLEIWGRLYNLNPDNPNFQLFYTASLVNSKNLEEIKNFLRSEGIISEIPKIIDQIELMAKLTDLWDFATLFLSRNGIYRDLIYQKYSERPTPVLTKIILENLRKKGKDMYIEDFMAVLSSLNPDDLESTIMYMEALLRNQKISVLKIHLLSLDLEKIKDEGILSRLLPFYYEAGLYDHVLNISSRILSVEGRNQIAIELRMKSFSKIGKDEEVIKIFGDHLDIIEKDQPNLEVFFNSAYNINAYALPLQVIESLDEKTRDNLPIRIWEIKFLLLSGNREKAEKIAQKISLDNISDPEILKIRVLLRRDDDKSGDFIRTGKKYIEANPHDVKFVKDFIRRALDSGYYSEIISLLDTNPSLKKDRDIENVHIISFLKTSQVELGARELKVLGIENMGYETFSSFLKACRNEKSFNSLSMELSSGDQNAKSLYKIIKGILFNNTLEMQDFNAIRNLLDSDIVGVLSLIYMTNSPIKYNATSDKEKKTQKILTGDLDEDLPEFLYPAVMLNIFNHNLAKANSIISKYEGTDDPFIYYFKSIISDLESNRRESKKYIEMAKNIFNSNLIMAQYLKLFQSTMEMEDIVKILEDVSKNGGIGLIDFDQISDRIINSKDTVRSNIIDMIEYSPVKSISSLRLLRDLSEFNGKQEESLEFDRKIFENPSRNSEDVKKYAIRLKSMNKTGEMVDLVSKVHDEPLPCENYAIFGDFFLSVSDFSSSIYYYEKALASGSDIERCKGIIDALIKEKRFDEALKYTKSLKIPTPYEAKVYSESNKPEELLKIIKKLDLRRESDIKGYEIVLDDYWNNRYIRKALMEKFFQYPLEKLSIRIAGLLLEEKSIDEALGVLRRSIKEKEQTGEALAYIIDLLCEYGKFEEAIEYAVKYLKSRELTERKKKIFLTISQNLVKYGYNSEVVKFYHEFPSLLDSDSCIPVIKALIKEEYFDSAEKILSKFQGQFKNKETFDELWSLLKKNWDFSEIIYYAGEYLKACFKKGRLLDKREAVAIGGVPVSNVEDVFEFINSRTNLKLFNQEYLEEESKNTILLMYKKLKIERIENISLADIFYITSFKDLKRAKAIYDYIQAERSQNHPLYVEKNSQLLNMANICIRENIPMNPITYSLRFNIGIRKAMELSAFLSNIDRVNN